MADDTEFEKIKAEAVDILILAGEMRQDRQRAKDLNKGIRFWAMRVAPSITLDQWQDMVWGAEQEVSLEEFPGDVVSFFERRFEGLRLADGSLMLV